MRINNMAIDLATASELFVTEVQQQYQNMRSFAGAALERHGLEGQTANFPVGGIGEMEETGFGGGDIPVSELNETNVPISVGNFHYKTTIGGGYNTLFSYDKVTENAREHAIAGARKLDKLLVDAIYTAGTGTARFDIIPATFGSIEGLSVDKLSLSTDLLLDGGVGTMINKNALVPALARGDLKKDPAFSSWDYNMNRPLMNNKLPGYLDVAFFAIGSKGSNALPRTGAGTVGDPYVYEIPVFAEDAIRLVFNRELQSTITWVPQDDRWELVSSLTARAGVIQPSGVKIITANVVTQA